VTPTSEARGASTSPTTLRLPSRASKCQLVRPKRLGLRATLSGLVERKSTSPKRPTTGVLGPSWRPKRGTKTLTPST
jgi:hypothetical protein